MRSLAALLLFVCAAVCADADPPSNFTLPTAQDWTAQDCPLCPDTGPGGRSSLVFRTPFSVPLAGVLASPRAARGVVFSSLHGQIVPNATAGGGVAAAHSSNGTVLWFTPLAVFDRVALRTRGMAFRVDALVTDLAVAACNGEYSAEFRLVVTLRSVVMGVDHRTGNVTWARMIYGGYVLPIPDGRGCAPFSFLNVSRDGVACVDADTGETRAQIVWGVRGSGPQVLSGWSLSADDSFVAIGMSQCGAFALDPVTLNVLATEFPSGPSGAAPGTCQRSVRGAMASFSAMDHLSPAFVVTSGNDTVRVLSSRSFHSYRDPESNPDLIDPLAVFTLAPNGTRAQPSLARRSISAFPASATHPDMIVSWDRSGGDLRAFRLPVSLATAEPTPGVLPTVAPAMWTLARAPGAVVRDFAHARPGFAVLVEALVSADAPMVSLVNLATGKVVREVKYPSRADPVFRYLSPERGRGMQLRDWTMTADGSALSAVVFAESGPAAGFNMKLTSYVLSVDTAIGSNATTPRARLLGPGAVASWCTMGERFRRPAGVELCPGPRDSPCSGFGRCERCQAETNPAARYGRCLCQDRLMAGDACDICATLPNVTLVQERRGARCHTPGKGAGAVVFVFILVFGIPVALVVLGYRHLRGIIKEEPVSRAASPWASSLGENSRRASAGANTAAGTNSHPFSKNHAGATTEDDFTSEEDGGRRFQPSAPAATLAAQRQAASAAAASAPARATRSHSSSSSVDLNTTIVERPRGPDIVVFEAPSDDDHSGHGIL